MSENYLALLGTKGGPAVRPGSTMPTSNLLCLGGKQIVIDCGLGVTKGLIDQGMDLKNLSLIFITHMHSDHYLELGPMLHTSWTAGLASRVEVWGPVGIADYFKHFMTSMVVDVDLRMDDEGRVDLRELVHFHEIEEGAFLQVADISISAMRTEHPPLEDVFALRFKSAAHDVVFSADTAYLPKLAEFAKGADILVHEAMLAQALEALVARVGAKDDRLMKHLTRSHTLAEDAGRIATAAGIRRLALNHLIPSDDPDFGDKDWHRAVQPTFEGELIVGKDGLRIDL